MGQHPRQPTDDEFDVLFETSTRKDMVKHERLWRDSGWVVSWVDRRPKYTCTVDWGGSAEIVVGMTAPGERSWCFSMIGGGIIEVIETWYAPAWIPKLRVRLRRTVLRVVAQPNGARRVYVGKLGSVGGAMWAHAVLMPHYAMFAQPVADRVAQTLRALTDVDEHSDGGKCTDPVPARFYALLDGSRGCAVCHRPLTDDFSLSIGVDPDCARAWRIPYTREAATTRARLRADILDQKNQ
jgi:hypothetical protein